MFLIKDLILRLDSILSSRISESETATANLKSYGLRTKMKITRMISCITISLLIGNMPNIISHFLISYNRKASIYIKFAYSISNVLLFLCHGTNIIFYYNYNGKFQRIFESIFIKDLF